MNNKKQLFYKYVTTPIAKVLDFVNVPKQIELRKRRNKIAEMNKCEYIQTTSKVLFETELQEHLNIGEIPHPLALPIIIERNIQKATEMFYEKKKNGDFDELNLLIK